MSEFRTIFISGPSEIEPVATAVKTKLEANGHKVIRMPFDAQPLEPGRLSLKELAKCQAAVLILNEKYGTPQPKFDNKSITELEFDETLRRRLPLFCFIGKDATSRDPRLIELVSKVDLAAKERRLDFTYTKTDFTDKDSAVQEICRSVEGFRWTPKEFSSFGEWEVFLAHLHSRIAKDAPDPDKLPSPIGRAKPRQDMMGALLSNDKGGVVLSGLPAHGKTLFVYHAIRDMIDAAKTGYPDIHVILSGQPVSIESVRQITPDPGSNRPLILVIDDADERDDLPNLVKMLANSPHFPRMRIVLICQEGEEKEIFRRCHPFVSPELFPPLTLTKLTFDELKEYVRANNMTLTEPNVLAIHGITNGVPLYVDLYFHHNYDPRIISNAAVMQSHFRDYILGALRNPGKESQLAAVKALALVGGASTNDPILKQVFETLNQPGDLQALLDEIRQQHLVYLVGRKFKLHNRIVQDFILTEYWAKKPDFYLLLPLILKIKGSAKPILENIARAEWVIQKSSGAAQPSSFADIWAAFEVSFGSSADIEERTGLLKLLADTAYYLPDLGLRLLQQTHKRYVTNLKGLNDLQKDEVEAASQIAYSLAQVSRGKQDRFEECIDYLWDFGKYDQRILSSCPSHAHRHLESLTEFRPGRPMKQYITMMNHIETWLKQSTKEPIASNHSPLEILDKLLEREWEQSYFHRNVFTIQHGPLPHDVQFEELKLNAIKLVGRCIRGEFGDRLIPETTHLLRGQLPIYQPKDWGKLGEIALQELTDAADQFIAQGRCEAAYSLIYTLDDLLYIFEEKEREGMGTIRGARDSLNKKLSASFPQKYKILRGLIGRRFTGSEPEYIQQAQEMLISLEINKAFEILEEMHDQLDSLELKPYTPALAHSNANNKTWMDFSARLAVHVLMNGKNPGLVWSGVHFMWGCRVAASASAPEKKKYLDFLKLFNKTISSAAIPQQTKTNLEDSCRRFIWLLLKDHPGISLFAEEGDLISRWKISPDPTWGLIVTKLAETDTQAAKSLLLAASIGGDPNYASEVCTALLESPALLAAFQESDWKSSLNKLTEVSKIEDYWIQQALIRCSNLFPLATANFLIQRIQRQETLENSQADYRPLPYLIEDDLKGAFAEIDSSLRIQLLNEAIDLIKNSQRGSLASLLYAEYASLISGQLSSEVRSILGQRGPSSDPSELEAVAVVIQHSYPDFALDHAGIVDTLLTSAKKISNETLRRVRSCLSAGAHTRSISRQFGEPSKAHIQMRDRAAEIKRQFFPNSPTYEFYADLEKSAQWDIDREVERDAEVLDE